VAGRAGSTIYHVAERAEVSITTVSRFLNFPDLVNEATARKIQDAMDSLAYIPHGNSGTATQRQIGRVGVLAPFFTAPSFVQRIQGMTPVLRQANTELVVYSVDSPAQLDEYLQSVPFTKRLDGLIILSMALSPKQIQRLERSATHVVLVEQAHPAFSSVEIDNVQGGRLAAQFLLDRRLFPAAFVGEVGDAPFSLQPSALRWRGYSEVLAAAGQPVRPEHVALGQGSVEDAYRMAMALLSGHSRPRAVFAMSDLMAIGVLRAARTLGMSVPQEVAVLGFDDIEAAGWMELSTVSQNLGASGRLAAEILLERIKNPSCALKVVPVDLTLIERSTT
jgi:LacI family transcriptional regulator